MSIFWAEGPLRPHASPGPDTWATPADGKPHWARILGDPVPVWLHWLDKAKRTVPCSAPDCQHCPTIRQQQKLYAPASVAVFMDGKATWIPRIIELTENARDELLKDDFRPIIQWRGTLIQLRRVGRVVHATVDDRPIAEELPPSWDIKPTLIRMWQIREAVLPSKDAAGDEPRPLPFRRESQ